MHLHQERHMQSSWSGKVLGKVPNQLKSGDCLCGLPTNQFIGLKEVEQHTELGLKSVRCSYGHISYGKCHILQRSINAITARQHIRCGMQLVLDSYGWIVYRMSCHKLNYSGYFCTCSYYHVVQRCHKLKIHGQRVCASSEPWHNCRSQRTPTWTDGTALLNNAVARGWISTSRTESGGFRNGWLRRRVLWRRVRPDVILNYDGSKKKSRRIFSLVQNISLNSCDCRIIFLGSEKYSLLLPKKFWSSIGWTWLKKLDWRLDFTHAMTRTGTQFFHACCTLKLHMLCSYLFAA